MTTDPSVDGRRARPERGRQAVVDAILALLAEGDPEPGAQAIADRAGVSVRSVFRYYEDLDALAEAAVDRQILRAGHLYADPDPIGTLDERIAALVTQRRRLWEEVAPVRRYVGRRTFRQPRIADVMVLANQRLRDQVEEQFRAELDRVEGTARRDLLDALDVATSWPTWEHLRTDLERTAPRAAATVARTLHALAASV